MIRHPSLVNSELDSTRLLWWQIKLKCFQGQVSQGQHLSNGLQMGTCRTIFAPFLLSLKFFPLLNFRSGTYEIQEAEGVEQGTKIVIHLKPECRQFADDETVKGN